MTGLPSSSIQYLVPSALVIRVGRSVAGVGLRAARCAGSSGGGGLGLRAVVDGVVVDGDVAVTVGGGGLDLAAMVDAVAGGT